MITDAMRVEIVAANGIHSADELATIYDLDRSDILRVWFRHAAGYRPISQRTGAVRIVFGDHTNNGGPTEAVLVDDEPLVDSGLTLMELGDIHCRWIIGRDVDSQPRYCGEDRAKNVKQIVRCYCVDHARQAITADISEDILIEPRFPKPARIVDIDDESGDEGDLIADVERDITGGANHITNMGAYRFTIQKGRKELNRFWQSKSVSNAPSI